MATCDEDWDYGSKYDAGRGSGGRGGNRSHEERGGYRNERSAGYKGNRQDQEWEDHGERESNSRRDREVLDFNEELDVRQEYIGMIIGRAGSNIQRIQTDYNVRVDLDKRRKVATISGNSQGNVSDAVQFIQKQIESAAAGEHRGGGGGGFGGDDDYRRSNDGWQARRSGGGSSYNQRQDYHSHDRYDGRTDGRNNRGNFGRGNYKQNNYQRDNYQRDNYQRDNYQRDNQRDNYQRDNYQRDNYQRDNYQRDNYQRDNNYERDNYEDRSKNGRNGNNDFYSGSTETPEDDSPNGVIDWDNLNKKAEKERAKRWAACPPLTKNFYKEAPEVANLLPEEVDRIRAENNNTTVSRVFEQKDGSKENDIPNPVWKFEHCFDAYPDLLAEIQKQNFTKPSPIQAQAWPILLKGEDIIGIAQTGTGKTLAFLLPAMIHTEYQSTPRSERGGPNVLVMAPTRELALQIEKEVNKYSFRGMKAVCVYGGGNRREQISDVERGTEIIICTPGRLNDLIQANVIDVASITYLVLDEADRMLDMGFEPQIRKILLDIRPDRQTVMTSATWPPGVRRLAQSYMNNPIQICVGSLDLAATHTVEQIIEIMDETDKFYNIKRFVKRMKPDDKIIVFCGKKTRADDLSSDLTLEGYLCQCIHGSREQSDREQAIADITSGEVKILIATDVASRGLDIEDITHVINFDFPRNIEEYVHRVGRTGRAGRLGTSISYITRTDWAVAAELIDILKEAQQEVPEELREMAARFKSMKDRRADENGKFNSFRGGRGRGGGGGGFRRDRY